MSHRGNISFDTEVKQNLTDLEKQMDSVVREAIEKSHAAVSRLVGLLHHKAPILLLDVELVTACFKILSSAITDARNAADLGRSVGTAEGKAAVEVHLKQAKEEAAGLRTENERLQQLVKDQQAQLDGFKDMAQCLREVCYAASESSKGDNMSLEAEDDEQEAEEEEEAAVGEEPMGEAAGTARLVATAARAPRATRTATKRASSTA